MREDHPGETPSSERGSLREGPSSARASGVGGVYWVRIRVCVLNVGGPNHVVGASTVNVCPAVTYSPTPSRVQYHRRCGS